VGRVKDGPGRRAGAWAGPLLRTLRSNVAERVPRSKSNHGVRKTSWILVPVDEELHTRAAEPRCFGGRGGVVSDGKTLMDYTQHGVLDAQMRITERSVLESASHAVIPGAVRSRVCLRSSVLLVPVGREPAGAPA
jgi:hypothetical protein